MVVVSGNNGFNKEMAIRRRIINIYNKREEDFSSSRDYNDYLEEVEDMIVNLIDGIDVPAIEVKIAEYQRENAEQIMNAQARKAEEIAAAMAASKGQTAQSDGSVGTSQSSHAGMQGHYAPAVPGGTIAQPMPTGVAPKPIPAEQGSDAPGNNLGTEEMRKLKAERAGGWSTEISKKRALEEAFASIWI